MSGIYLLINKDTGYFYIGRASNLKQRKYEHFSDLKLNRHKNRRLQADYNKYKNIVFVPIERAEPKELIDKEKFYLKRFLGESYCYNMR